MLRFVSWIFVLTSLLLASTSIRATPQAAKGRIDILVSSLNGTEAVPGVTLTLVGPSPVASSAQIAALYTPNPALAPDMKAQIDALITSAPIGITADVLATAARRMEAQMLGLPTPNIVRSNAPPTPQVSGFTGSNGRYSFTDLAPGRYVIQAQKAGYLAKANSLVPIGQPLVSETISLEVGQASKELEIGMIRGGIISGRVRDPNGQPIPNAQIAMFEISYQNSRVTLQQINSRQADDRGEYRLFGMYPGDYCVGVIPSRPGINANSRDTFARTYFPGTTDPGSAARVKVHEGVETAGIDFSVRADATGKISGRVMTSIVAPNGQPATVPTFYLLPSVQSAVDSGAVNVSNIAADRTNGQFEIRGVLPGSYDLIAVISANPGGTVLGRTYVEVGGAVENVIINVNEGTPVRAKLILDSGPIPYTMVPTAQPPRVVTVDGAILPATAPVPATIIPVPTPTYRIQLRSMVSNISVFDSAAQRGMIFDPSGLFTFPSVPDGRYSVAVTPILPNSYIADVRSGDKSIFDNGFELGELTGEIEVTVSGKGAKVQGVVRDEMHKPAAATRVILVPPPARRKNLALYKAGVTDDNGRFSFTGVAPGDYRLYSWETIPNNAWLSAEFMAPYENLGQVISVTQGSETTKDLTLIPATAVP